MSIPYLNRELSWIEFNQRVLNEALREDLPLLERVKFLSISASNLDEFFQVRIGGLMLLRRSGRKTPDASGFSPARNLIALRQRILKMYADQYSLLTGTLVPALDKAGIHPLQPHELTVDQAAQAGATFEDLIFPLLTPLAVDPESAPPMVPALQIIVACRLLDQETQSSRHALIPIPEALGRRVGISVIGDDQAFILIEDLVAIHAGQLFPGEKVVATTAFRVTRNGDIAVQEEDAIDLAGEMEDVLTARRFADTVRLELRSDAPRDLVRMIKLVTATSPQEVYRLDGPPGLASFMELAFLSGFDHLRDVDWPAQNSPAIAPGASMFETIATGDVLLFHPYESFEPVLRLIEEAAEDPEVIAIKQVLYRTARKSRIIDALIKAAENGKHVTVLVELKARFDEERNIALARELEAAGVQVVYGFVELKTHAKVSLVVRREGAALRSYAHFGTGNYHPITARIYTDLSFFTASRRAARDAAKLFNLTTGYVQPKGLELLTLSPHNLREKFLSLIDAEIAFAKESRPAAIWAKMNSLVDHAIIDKLYEASEAGVSIDLIIRGVCCLRPGVAGMSSNIRVKSIVGRFLEHSRIFVFANGHRLPHPKARVFMSSADWMARNFYRRVEFLLPIENPTVHAQVLDQVMIANLIDNEQSWLLLPDGSYRRMVPGKRHFNLHHYFMNNPSLSGRGHSLGGKEVPKLRLTQRGGG